MARKKTSSHRLQLKTTLSDRLREVRQDLFGDHGGPELARQLGLPARTWYNYESGVTVPAEILLAFIEQTHVNTEWLLTGQGPHYRRAMEDRVISKLTAQELIRRGLEKLELQRAGVSSSDAQPIEDFVAVRLVDEDPSAEEGDYFAETGESVLIYRGWVPKPEVTIAFRIHDESMHPILPAGSVVAIDQSLKEPSYLQGQIVAARIEDRSVVRWLDFGGKQHVILRPERPGPHAQSIAVNPSEIGSHVIILGRIVWSWSRFT